MTGGHEGRGGPDGTDPADGVAAGMPLVVVVRRRHNRVPPWRHRVRFQPSHVGR